MLEFTKWLNENSLGTSLTAYHCGPDRSAFSLSYIGTGEGLQALGPGIYFITNPHTATAYCKYSPNPILFEVTLNTENLYGIGLSYRFDMGNSHRLHGKFDEIASKFGYSSVKNMPTGSSLRQGAFPMGQIVREVGNKKAIDLFLEHGIDGAYELMPTYEGDYGLEIAVWNMNIIKMKNKWPMESKGYQELPKELPQPESLFAKEYITKLGKEARSPRKEN